MGYYVHSKKINMILDKVQQEKIFDIWMNPSEELKRNNYALSLLSPIFNAEEKIYAEKKCENIKDILNAVGFQYEECKKGLKLKSHEAKFRHQKELFSAVSHIITPGSFITLRGEDGLLIGFFFNGQDLIDYSSYDELRKLQEPIALKNNLEKSLPEKNLTRKVKNKM